MLTCFINITCYINMINMLHVNMIFHKQQKKRVANSAIWIPDPPHFTNPTKTWPTVNKLTFTAFSLFFVWLKPQPHGKQ